MLGDKIVGKRLLFGILISMLLVTGCTQPTAETPAPPTPAPLAPPTPFVPVVEPSSFSLWIKSDIGPIYVEETHYAKPSLDGRYLYIFNAAECHITVLDLENRTIIQDIKMPSFCSQATEMIFSSDGRWMYTLNAARVGDRHVVVIDTRTQDIDHLILLPEEAESSSANPNITISPDEQFLYVSLFQGIYRVSIESEQITKLLDIKGISFLAFTSEGKYLLGTNIVTNSLDIIDPDSGKLVGSIPVGDSPQYILNSPDGRRVYISNWESGDVSVVDLNNRKVITTVPVGVNPLGLTITPDGGKLYVAVTAQALEVMKVEFTTQMKVVVINTKIDTVSKEIMTGWAPRFINISRDGAKVYVGEYVGKVHIIDTSSDEVVDSILLNSPITYLPDDIAITPDGSKLLVYARGIQQVMVIDTVTHALLARFNSSSDTIAISSDGLRAYIPGSRFTVIDIPNLTAKYIETPDIGGGTVMIILSKDDHIAYIADFQRDLLQVVDLENWRLIANIPVGDMGIWAFGLAITPDGNKVFVCNGYSNDISVVSTAENRVIETIPMKSTPVGIAISPDGRVAYVTERQPGGDQNVVAIDVATHKIVQRWHDPLGFGNPFEVAISPNGKYAYFAGGDWEIVAILDIESGATRYVDVGLNPFHIALTKDGRLLYVSNEGSDDIAVINTQTEKVVDRIPIQVKGTGFIYATLTDSRGKIVSIERPVVGYVPYDQGIQGNFESSGFAPRHLKLDGCWIPVPEGDYLLWTSTNLEGLCFVSQIYDGIGDYGRRVEASRVRVREGRITSVNFVLQEGHQVSGILVDKDGNQVSTGGSMVNTQTRASIGGCIGFVSDRDGRFLVNVPDGVYDLSFGYANRGVIVAKDMKVFQDVDLGKVIINP
jgi:YVTN family beta-propeller protein